MDDVIINSEPMMNEKTQPVKAPVKKDVIQKNKKKRNFFLYLLNLFQKTLIAALLICINFVLFCGAGSMNMFAAPFVPSSEVLMIMAGVGILCFVIIFLFSFSEFLQNLFLADVAAVVFSAMLNQFALFDKGAVFYDWAKKIAGNDASYFAEYSHYILAAFAALIMFVFAKRARKSTVFYFIAVLFLIMIGIAFDNYLEKNNNSDYRVVFENPDEDGYAKERGKKFVYIAMPNLASYSYLQSVGKDNPKAQKALAVMLGFYNNNGFTMYTNALSSDKNADKNLVNALNLDSVKKAEEFELKRPWNFGNWDFAKVKNPRIFLKKNKIFDVMQRSGYEVNAYQTKGLELCLKNNGPAVNHCVEKNNFPLKLESENLSLTDKTFALGGEWLESTGLLKGSSILHSVFDTFMNVDRVPFVGTAYDKLNVVNAHKMLDVVADDISKNKKDNAYFVFFDLPSDMYIYDEFCRIKPMSLWVRKDDLKFGTPASLAKKRDAYFDQLACAYGRLQSFIEKLQKNGNDKNVVLIIQGLNGLNDEVTTVATENLQNRQSVSMAIRDPLRHGFGVKKDICMTSDILQNYLFKKEICQADKALDVHAEVYKNLVNALEKRKITKADVGKAADGFALWYKEWKDAQEKSEKIHVVSEAMTKGKVKGKDVHKLEAIVPLKNDKNAVKSEKTPEVADVEKKEVKSGEMTSEKSAENKSAGLENKGADTEAEKSKSIGDENSGENQDKSAEMMVSEVSEQEKADVVSEKSEADSGKENEVDAENVNKKTAIDEKAGAGEEKAVFAEEFTDELGLVDENASLGEPHLISKEEAEVIVKSEDVGTLKSAEAVEVTNKNSEQSEEVKKVKADTNSTEQEAKKEVVSDKSNTVEKAEKK